MRRSTHIILACVATSALACRSEPSPSPAPENAWPAWSALPEGDFFLWGRHFGDPKLDAFVKDQLWEDEYAELPPALTAGLEERLIGPRAALLDRLVEGAHGERFHRLAGLDRDSQLEQEGEILFAVGRASSFELLRLKLDATAGHTDRARQRAEDLLWVRRVLLAKDANLIRHMISSRAEQRALSALRWLAGLPNALPIHFEPPRESPPRSASPS
jgi:hypothetical protein